MGWSSNRPTDYFAVGVQEKVGVEATTFFYPKHLTGTGFDSIPDVGEEREGGGGQEVALVYRKLIKADGNAVANARGHQALYAIIDGALGLTATSAGPPGFSGEDVPTGMSKRRMVMAATLPYLTTEQRYSDEVERVSNAKVNTLTFEGAAGLPVKITAAIVGAGTVFQKDTASALTPVYEVTDPIYFPRGSYSVEGGAANVASGAKMTKYKVTVMRHLDEAVQTTELWRDDLVELTSDTTLDVTFKYEDRKLYQQVVYGGGSVVPIPVSSLSFMAYMTNGQASGATLFRSLRIGMANLLAKSAKVNKLEPDGKTVYIDVACTSVKGSGATDSIVVDLVVASNAFSFFP